MHSRSGFTKFPAKSCGIHGVDLVLVNMQLVECDPDGANHVVDFKTLQGLSHYNSTSTIPGPTLEKRQTKVNNEYHKRAKNLDADLHGTSPVQWGAIEAELNEYGHNDG